MKIAFKNLLSEKREKIQGTHFKDSGAIVV